MAWCEDKAITFLNKFGYNVIKLPRAGIEPLNVFGRDRVVQPLGTAAQFWGDDPSLPQPTGPQPTAFASGVESDDLELKLGLNVLQNALAGLGVNILDGGKLEASYRNAKSIKFKIDKPFSVSIELLALSNYLKGRTLDWSNDLVKRYFLDEDRDVFIITEVLKSQNFSITATDAQSANVDVDVSLLKGAVSGTINIQPVKTDSTQELQFSGESPITFGFKCIKVRFHEGTWKLRDVEAAGALSFDPNAAGAANASDLLSDGGLLRLSS